MLFRFRWLLFLILGLEVTPAIVCVLPAPAPPLLAPVDNATLCYGFADQRVRLSWGNIPDATEYLVKVQHTSVPVEEGEIRVLIPELDLTERITPHRSPYQWSVSAVVRGTTTATSPARGFKFQDCVLPMLTIIQPAPTAHLVLGDNVIKLNCVDDYQLASVTAQLDNGPITSLPITGNPITGTIASPPLPPGEVQLTVSAKDTFDNVTTKSVPVKVGPIPLLNPITATLCPGDNAMLTWQAVPDATGYHVEVSPTSNFATRQAWSTTGTSWSFTVNQPYFWRVAAIGPVTLGAFTPPSPISVDDVGPVISAVTAQAFAGGDVLISWTTNELATSRVIWGTSSGSLPNSSSPDSIPDQSSHAVNISTGQGSGTIIFYKVESIDTCMNISLSPEGNVTIP